MMNFRVLFMVASMVLSGSSLLGQLRIDFNYENNNVTSPTQNGFTEITGGGGTVTNDYGVGGTNVIVLTSGLDDRERGALTGGPGVAQSDLLRDFIFRNTGTGLGITLSTLEFGEYTFTGFFHDCTAQQENGTLGVDTHDGQGEVLKVTNFAYSTGTAPAEIGSASLSFVADGIHSVTVYLRDTNTVHTQPYCINGFILEKTVYPKGPEDLVAYYNFEESFTDSSGNDRHGVPSGAGVTLVTDTPPMLTYSTKACDFNGTNYVTLPYLGLYSSLAATNGLTISLWIKGDSATPQSWFISEGYTGDALPAYVFGHTTDDNPERPTALIRTLSGTTYKIDATSQLYNGNWHHWVWTDINGTANMYIDGVPVAAASGTWNYTHGDIPFNTTALGAWVRNKYESRKYPFTGQMDDVSIWNTVLSENQIKYLANGGDPLSLGRTGVILMLK